MGYDIDENHHQSHAAPPAPPKPGASVAALVHEAGWNSHAHGFWEGGWNDGEKVALVHSEASELLEEIRMRPKSGDHQAGWMRTMRYREDGKPEGVPSEAADVVIRMMDFCAYHGIDLERAILEKMAYNRSRPHMHGGKAF